MNDSPATRSAVIELKDERRAMHEGYVFLDEKCLLLAGEILRELRQYALLQAQLAALQQPAAAALQAATLHLGLQGLQVYPRSQWLPPPLHIDTSSLMGVPLQQAQWPAAAPHAAAAVQPSVEAEACRHAFAALLPTAAALAAVSGNLERLSAEYQRTLRRARALQDLLLPELDQTIGEIEGRLDELEQEDAIWMRRGAVR